MVIKSPDGSTIRLLLNCGRTDPLQLGQIDIDEETRECMTLLKYRMKLPTCLTLQTKLLRALQEHEFERVGGTRMKQAPAPDHNPTGLFHGHHT